MNFLSARLAFGLCLVTSSAFAADKVSFGTNWLAEAEHGGYYQAVADGTYAKYGLDVTIVQGGPQANNELLLAAGRLDFYMGGNLLLAFDAVARDVPIVVMNSTVLREVLLICTPYRSIRWLRLNTSPSMPVAPM